MLDFEARSDKKCQNWPEYTSVPNRRACMFISGKVGLLSCIDVKRQTLPEINVHAHLFGTLEYAPKNSIIDRPPCIPVPRFNEIQGIS